jgi:hypothetical protein
VGELEQWLEAGRLDRVADGGPFVDQRDIGSFLATDTADPLTSPGSALATHAEGGVSLGAG